MLIFFWFSQTTDPPAPSEPSTSLAGGSTPRSEGFAVGRARRLGLLLAIARAAGR
jgi:hypothetical protein